MFSKALPNIFPNYLPKRNHIKHPKRRANIYDGEVVIVWFLSSPKDDYPCKNQFDDEEKRPFELTKYFEKPIPLKESFKFSFKYCFFLLSIATFLGILKLKNN